MGLLREGDRVTGIQTRDGPEHAGVVVAAAGVWSPALLASIGVDLPIETEFHQVAVLSHAPGQGTPVACIDSTTQTYFRPEAGGTMTLVGSFTGPRGVDPDRVASPEHPAALHDVPLPTSWPRSARCICAPGHTKCTALTLRLGERGTGWRRWWGRRPGGYPRWLTRGSCAASPACTT